MKKIVSSLVSLGFLASATGAWAADQPANPANAPSYVKLLMSYRNTDGASLAFICGGTLISNELVITASHCIPDAWVNASERSLTFNYGTNFSTTARLHAGESWVKFDPAVDLALIRMDRGITSQSGATAAVLDTACPNGPQLSYPLNAVYYQRMSDAGSDLPRASYQTTTGQISSYGRSVLANGYAYISNRVGRAGDSGSSVFSANHILIGVYNGEGGNNSYSAALCLYRNQIDSSSTKLLQLK